MVGFTDCCAFRNISRCVSHWAESETRLQEASQLPRPRASELGLRGLKNKEQVASSRLHNASSANLFAAWGQVCLSVSKDEDCVADIKVEDVEQVCGTKLGPG